MIRTSPRPRWNFSWQFDLLTLAIIPVVGLALLLLVTRVADMTTIALVGAAAALAHTLPGMVQAYSSSQLMARYPIRLFAVPIGLIVLGILAARSELHGLALVIGVYAVWHVTAQTIHICQDYAHRERNARKAERLLDSGFCVAWFLVPIVYSDARLVAWLNTFHLSGGPPLPTWIVPAFREVALVFAIGTSLLYGSYYVMRWVAGERVNYVKIAILFVSLGAWAFVHFAITELVVAIALFELFHALQYLALTTSWSREAASTDDFNKSGRSGILSVVALTFGVMALGSLAFANHAMPASGAKTLLTGLLSACLLTHYYFDGFVWSLHHKPERLTAPVGDFDGVRHLASWGLFAVPLGILCLSQSHAAAEPTRLLAVANSVPTSAVAQHDAAETLSNDGRVGLAVLYYRRAIRLDDRRLSSKMQMVDALRRIGRNHAAIEVLKRVVHEHPRHVDAFGLLGTCYATLGQNKRAKHFYHKALHLDANNVEVLNNLGIILARQKRFGQAEARFRQALVLDPERAQGNYNLGNVLYEQGNYDAAKKYLERALQLEPGYAKAQERLRELQEDS